MLKRKVFFQGKQFIIEECDNGDIIVDNVRYSPEIKKGAANTYKVKLNKKVYTIEIKDNKIFLDGSEVEVNIRPFIELKENMHGTTERKEVFVTAPIPGKISQILVKKGDKVEKDQELIILEAMKMRNRILAPIKGKIEDILVTNETNVQQDQKLIKIVPEK